MYNNVSKSSLKQLQWTLNVYYYYYYCKKTNNIALKYNNKVKGKEKREKRHTPVCTKKKFFENSLEFVFNELKWLYNKGNLSKKHIKSRQRQIWDVFVNKTFTMYQYHGHCQKSKKKKYIFKWKV